MGDVRRGSGGRSSVKLTISLHLRDYLAFGPRGISPYPLAGTDAGRVFPTGMSRKSRESRPSDGPT